MNTYDTILVPTDGSDHALRAARYGAQLADAFDATLHVLTVVDVQAAIGPFNAGGLDSKDRERLERNATDVLEDVLRTVDSAGDVESAVLTGTPRAEILDYAADQNVDFVAMGTQGRTGVDRYVTGSVAEGVVRKAAVPVLTVRATEETPAVADVDDILVPTDGSPYADAAVAHALALGERFSARIHALHVVNVGAAAANPSYEPPTTHLEDLRSQGEAATEAIADRAHAVDLDAETHVEYGLPASYILDYAREHEIGLIAMGTAGRTGLNRFLLGSTTERVIRHADRPVLAVNARDGTSAKE